ncbi:MAG TPA: UvrD-helicase domain-containing protein [Thermoanaerobaculia bacterium]|nr:UvrD-helicase domain-containing protein [Thermoanaerobaculia bacterium]
MQRRPPPAVGRPRRPALHSPGPSDRRIRSSRSPIPSARAAIAHHLANIDSLRSQTIHSFCQSLLRSFPIEAGLDPQFKIIEGFERSLVYGQIYDAWLDDETRVHPVPEHVAQWELLFEHAGYLFQIRDLVLALVERRDLLLETEYDFGDISDVEPVLLDAIHAIRRCDEDAGDDDARRIFAYVRERVPHCTTLEEWIAYLQPIATHIREANLPRKGVLKEALNLLRSGSKGKSIYDRLVGHRAAMALVALTRRFLDFLDAEKRKLGVVDFDDLLLRTLALLDDPAVLARARGQFDFIFVDEFQDTDRTQARIIGKLARDPNELFVPGKTIVVGDPKQSIYGFRRADPETYYRMTDELARAGADVRIIGDQYRSDPELLAVINAMFLRLFPDEQVHDPNVFRPSYKPLRAARREARRQLDARVTLLAASPDGKADRYFTEAELVARHILDRRDGGPNDLQRFAILFRRLTKLDDYLDTLDRYGIDYVLPPTRLFLDRPAPVDLVAVLRAIAYSFDRGAQISAARSPYFALTDVEIAAQSDAWQAFEQTMARFREAARHCTVADLIDLVVRTCNIEQVYATAADGHRSLRHLEHVRAIAFEYDLRLGGSVRQFVDEIAHRRGEPEEMEPSLVDESRNAVRIMSVHAAKGLEFETVILPDLSVQSPQNGIGLFAVEEPEKSLVMTGRATTISANFRSANNVKLKEISKQRDDAEIQRLFYVAVTRAMTDVVFVLNPDEKKPAGFHKCLMQVLEGTPLEWPSVIDSPIGRIACVVPGEHEGRAARGEGRLRDASLQEALARSPIVPVEVPLPPVVETLTTGEVAARRAGSRSRAAGTLLHRVLELWDGRTDVEPLLRQLAGAAAADADTIQRVRRRIAVIARSPMLQRIQRAETIGREVPVRFLENGILVERRIDRIIREGDRDVVIDYKSGTPDPARVEKDREQVTRYREAIRAITGRDCAGVLWYIGMDEDRTIEV